MSMFSTTFKKQYLFEQPTNGSAAATGVPSDRWLLVSVVGLMMAGLLAVYSSIAYFAETHNTTAGTLVGNHAIKLVISLLVMVIVSKFDYRLIAKLSRYALLLSWLFLIIVSIYGTEVFGARRSLSLGGFSFQPSSLATVSLLVYVSWLVSQKQEYIRSFSRAFLPTMVWVLVTCALIGLEDFSSAALLLVMCLMIMFVGRVSVLHIGTLLVAGVIGAGALLSMSAERQSRVTNYVDQVLHIESTEFQLTSGYQAQQAHIAVAQGGLLGVGIGKSTQRDFLPAPYNDFIYAIITEEYGLLGAGVVMLLYVVILFRGIAVIAKRARDTLGMLMAVGCTLGVTMFAFVNAGVATGLLPVTGLPMPFISYGGTSMLFSGVLIGILLSISKTREVSHGG
ncbi:putative peptidoglycan glycosyltransferase FtsW [Balneolales bacterium ANBcel1]|nr:putative peptidoglycan glycosyltransferase FtsW [Balneolales bacterium ANBcel1]